MSNLRIESLKGERIKDYALNLAKLRIEVFKEYPYLYEGNLSYETDYIHTYVQCSEATFVLVFDGQNVVGVSTALPLEFETEQTKKPFIDNQMDVSNIFYFGESVLLPQYRKQGIYRQYFQERENAAKQYGAQYATFCAVVRQDDDKRRPASYEPLDNVWQHFGYVRQNQLIAHFTWKEIGDDDKTTKEMVFWMKKL